MLQWMGGSRQKVTTSRKSTQKRQKQYFEQRKRQQQDPTCIDNNIDGLVTCDDHKRNRSLDILSLLNVSKVSEECEPLYGIGDYETVSSMTNKATCASSVQNVNSSLLGKSKGHAFPASYHTSTSSPVIMTNELTATECTVPAGTRVPSLHQVGIGSSESSRNNSASNGKNIESEYLKNSSSIQPSIFDIIGDDEAIGTLEGEHAQEAHVAFSIEGLGKVGTETPLQSPQHTGSLLNGEQSSYTKAAKNLKSCQNFHTMVDDLDMEVECLMQDVEKPSHHIRLSGDVLYPINNTEHELLTFKDGMQLRCKQSEMNSLYDVDRNYNFWTDNSPCLDDYQIDEKCGLNWKEYDATNNLSTWRSDSSDFKFARCLEKIPSRLNYLDGHLRFPPLDDRKDCFSPFKKLKDARDSLTSFSGESCSSAAAGGDSTSDMPSARHIRRYGRDLDNPSMSNDYDEGMWNIIPTTVRQGQCHLSRKHVRSGSSLSNSALFSRAPHNNREGCRLLEEEFPMPKLNTHAGPFTSFKKNQYWHKDSFGLDKEAECLGSKCCFDSSVEDTPIEFSAENVAFNQSFCSRKTCNTSFISKAVYGGSSFGARDFEVSGDIESAFPAPELSEQGSVNEEGGWISNSQPPCPGKLVQVSTDDKNMTPESRLPTKVINLEDCSGSHIMTDNGISQEVTAYVLEADVDNKSNNEQNSSMKDSLGSIPVLCGRKVIGKDVDVDNLKGPERKSILINPCFQLMTVESCVLKLFSVPQKSLLFGMP